MSSCFWAHLMGFLSRHVTATSCGCGCHVAATWLPRHVAVAAVWFETEETTDELYSVYTRRAERYMDGAMAPSRERREGPAGGDHRDERGIVYLSTAVQNQLLDQVGWWGDRR